MTCDYALLARLLLEEQQLDQNKSVGKKGKYASKYHPRKDSLSPQDCSTSSSGSRPLTVGEIEVNWSDGACLSETLLTRYNVNGKNPLNVLQTYIVQQESQRTQQEEEVRDGVDYYVV